MEHSGLTLNRAEVRSATLPYHTHHTIAYKCVCVRVHARVCMALPTEPRESSHAIESKRDRNVMLAIFLFPLSPSFSLSPPLCSVKNTMPLSTLSFPHRDSLWYLGHSEFECSLVKHIHSTKTPTDCSRGFICSARSVLENTRSFIKKQSSLLTVRV